MLNVVFICTGNICRSPAAEGILRKEWEKLGRNDLQVSSMGIQGLDNQPASKTITKIAEENGIDLSEHCSRGLDFDELTGADIIFTMDRVQKDMLKMMVLSCREKVYLLGAWPDRKEKRKNEILDPMGRSERIYRKCYTKIDDAVKRVVPFLTDLADRTN